jgi:SAM-dependent methyltransferase
VDRTQELLKHISKDMRGIEIGPAHAPLAPKRDGFNSIALDVYTADQIVDRLKSDPNIPKESLHNIQEVDLLGNAGDIAELVEAKFGNEKFDYILSSHNLEHMPDPIGFLLGCERVLKPGGIVSLAVPDRRFMFDFFRPITTTEQWLQAHHERRAFPRPETIFQHIALGSLYNGAIVWEPLSDGQLPSPNECIEPAYAAWKEHLDWEGKPDRPYADSHCSIFTRSSFEIIVRDLQFLGLLRLHLTEMVGPNGCEFYAHLRNTAKAERPTKEAFYATRRSLLESAAREASSVTTPPPPAPPPHTPIGTSPFPTPTANRRVLALGLGLSAAGLVGALITAGYLFLGMPLVASLAWGALVISVAMSVAGVGVLLRFAKV